MTGHCLFLAARRIDSSFDLRAHVWRMWYPMELHRTTAKRASKQPLDCGSTTGRWRRLPHSVGAWGRSGFLLKHRQISCRSFLFLPGKFLGKFLLSVFPPARQISRKFLLFLPSGYYPLFRPCPPTDLRHPAKRARGTFSWPCPCEGDPPMMHQKSAWPGGLCFLWYV